MRGAKARLVWSADAEDDVLLIWGYGAEEWSADVADDHERMIWRTVNRLCENAHLGKLRDDLIVGVRSIVADPHIVFYRVTGNTIEIVRVVHQREDVDSIFFSIENF